MANRDDKMIFDNIFSVFFGYSDIDNQILDTIVTENEPLVLGNEELAEVPEGFVEFSEENPDSWFGEGG